MTMVFVWVMLHLSQACLAGAIHKTGLAALVVQDRSIALTNSSSSKIVTQTSGSIVSVQYYNTTGSIYFLHQRELRVQTLDSAVSQRVLTFPESMTITDLVLDPLTGYLFWTDSLNQTIYISKLGEYIKPVVQFDKEYKVLDIQLDTTDMWLLVAVRVGSITQIYRCEYNGANRTLLHHFSSTNSRIAVDSATKRLYLVDKYKPYVEILSYLPPTTSELRPLHLTREVRATSVTVSNNTLYLTGRGVAGVLAVDIQSGKETVLLQQFGSLRDIVLVEPMFTSSSLCGNASCPQLCTVAHRPGDSSGDSSPSAACFCSEGYTYDGEQGYCALDQDGSGQLFVCKFNGRVVSQGARCDGVNDCWDNSDETGCDPCEGFVCPSDNTCIPSSSLCNSHPECAQGEDELCCHDNVTCCRDVTSCTCDDVTEFTCTSGECVRGAGRCDGRQDCSDRSDEYRCGAERVGEGTFKCTKSLEYIPGKWKCDGRYDCADYSDEADCLGGGCNSTQITCDKGRCLDSQYQCDGVAHCRDMTDEITCQNNTCPTDYLPCANRTCLSAELFCNGAGDCDDETDEQCDFEKLLCSNTEFMCDSATCIPAGWQCDGKVDCSGGEDELGCPGDDNNSSCDDCTCRSDDDCSQSCVSAKCVCHQGYTLSSADNTTCIADTPARLYFLSGGHLYYSHIKGATVSAPILLQLHNISLVSTFDVFVDTGVIIAASGTQIYTLSSPNGSESAAELLIKRQKDIACIVVDWINNNIYWIEDGTLMMSNTHYTGLKTLTQGVVDVAIDAKYNALYYTTTTGSLIRCRLDMMGCTDIPLSDQVLYLYIDQVSRNIYYTTHNNSINRVDLSGTSLLLANSTTLGSVTLGHIVYFESSVYYFTRSDLQSYHRQSGDTSPVTLQLENGTPLTPTQITVSHASLQPTTSQRPCDASPCPQLCTQATPGTSTCLCSDLYSISDDRVCRYTGEECIAELKCDDRGCLQEESQRCDGFNDCYDGSEERHCNTECLSVEFKCGVGGCIHGSLRCDASQECIDGSDELNCTGSCNTGFLCATGRCINSKLHCNRHDDCGDNSDETVELCEHIPCTPDLFECEPNQCIPNSFVCNGYKDCANGTDEANCSSDQCAISCDLRESGEPRCLPVTARCNGIQDCVDGTDEAGCKTNNTCHEFEFRCKDGSGCISLVMKCDGVPQCTDRSDEQTCDRCKEGYTKCDNGHCVHPRYTCDGNRDCPLGEDEVNCADCTDEQISCDGVCLPDRLVCDGEVDCHDGRDEVDCSYPVCLPSQFMCSSGSCIDRHYRCDGSPDCNDNSDEINCSKCALSSFLCDTGLCLSQELVCDGKDDCGDDSDEQGCDRELINECSSRPCDLEHGQCVDLRLGYYCKCDPGYQLARNMKFCIDADECDLLTQSRQCSQQCYNRVGSFVCACYANFSLDRRDQVTCEPDHPLSFLLLSYHTLFKLSRVFPDYYDMTREVILYGLPDTVHNFAVHFTSTNNAFLYTAEGSSIKRYAIREKSSPVLDETWTTIEDVHVSSLAVDWITGNLYWSDPVLGEIKFLPSHFTTRPISLLTSFCDRARGLVLLPDKGKLYFIHVYDGVPGITEGALDGSRRMSVTGRGEVVSHFDIDEVTTTLYYITPTCDSHQTPCLYKRELKHANPQSTLLKTNLPEHITAFKVFASHGYLATGTKEILKCKLYADLSCSQFNALQPHISNILILSSLTQPTLKNACGDNSPCGDDTVCVNVPVDALGVQLQPSCVCKQSGYFYDNTSKKCRQEKTKCDPEMYFPCQTSGCVELRFRCDGIEDCSDGSDEQECDDHSCNYLMQFSCRSGHQCIPIERRCDGFNDCSDNSDETSCTSSLCGSDGTKFFCPGTKTCIPKSWVCDGTVDCHHGNGEDEVGCEGEVKCPFRCLNNAKNQECFPESIVGDGKVDCYYGKDEEVSGGECDEGQFQCGSSCYPDSWKCDMEEDCENDERSCQVASRPCPADHVPAGGPDSQGCVSKGLVCDGWADLADGRDELNCPNVTCDTSSFIQCEGLCVPAEWGCDGYCDSYITLPNCQCDETQRRCTNGQCIDAAHWCDGEDDCRAGLDEVWCPESDCDHTAFRCSYTGRCLRESVGVCDGANDCLDGSDEALCPQITYEQCTPSLYDCKTSEPLEDRCIAETKCNNATAHQQAHCTNKRDVMRCNQGDPCEGNGGCAHVCSALLDGTRQCSCYHGYVLDSDGRTCRDVNECKDPNTCSQVCENLKGSYTCSCLAGFVKSGYDGSSCKPASGPPEILLSTEFDMRTSTPRSYTRVTSGERRSFKFAFYSASTGKYYFVVGLVGRYTLETLSPDGTSGVSVVELDGEVHDVQYNPLTNNIVYCNTHSVNILSLTSILATTVDTNILHPVHRLALSPRYGKIFYIRDWKLGVMDSNGRSTHYLAADSHDYWTYQFKDGKITALSVDEPAKRIYWYNADLQQLSSATYAGSRVATVVNKLKHVQQIVVYGDHVFWHTAKALWEVNKRNVGEVKGRVRESTLPKCSHISVVFRDPAVLPECKECVKGICRIVEGSGPVCTRNHDNKTCTCENDGECSRSDNGDEICLCKAGYSGVSCTISKSNNTIYYCIAIGLLLLAFLVLIAFTVRYRHKYSISKIKNFSSNLFKASSIRYSRQANSVSIDNVVRTNHNSTSVGIVNRGCEEYDLEEITTDHSQLIEENFDFEEDKI